MTREEFARQTRERAYAERMGKVYGDFEVVSIRWDEEKKKQEWELRCTHCGITRKTTAWGNYTNGKVDHCKNCDRADNTLIGQSAHGYRVERAWRIDENTMGVEVKCPRCGRLIKGNYSEYALNLIKCGCS